MIKYLKSKVTYFVAFLAAFFLIGGASIVPTFAQDEIYFDEEAMAEWESAVAEWESSMQEYEETWDGDSWVTTYDTTGDVTDLAAFGIVMGIWAILMLPLYIYFALTLMVTAKKLGVSNAWFAWIPILNIILMLKCAGLSPWLFLLMFIPFINIIIMVFAYMKIAERRGFESWLGILIILPIANLIIPGYLAWGEPPKKVQ